MFMTSGGRDILGHLLALETRHQNGPLFQVFLKLGKEVEALVEHLDEERVALPNRQQLVGFGEKEAVVFGSQEDDRRLVAEPHGKDRAVLLIAAFQDRNRVSEKLERVSNHRGRTADCRG